MSKKIAFILPYAPAYREAIYTKIDGTFEVDWYFCNNSGHGLKQMDYTKFKSANTCLRETMFHGHSLWYHGMFVLPLKKYDYLIIPGQTHCLAEWMLLFLYGHKKYGPKVYLWTHGWYGKETKLQKILKKIFYHFADGLFLYGNRARRLMIDEGYDSSKLFTIHNSLQYDQQKSLRGEMVHSDVYEKYFANCSPVLIFIGRLTAVKKLDLLIDAVADLKAKGATYNIAFIGDGEMKNTLEDLAKAKEIEKQVWFYGACFDEKTNAELIYNADICVAPGNVGLTAIHAMMFGTPVISHNDFQWQMPEFEAIIAWKTGAFFKRNDKTSLVSVIENWFSINGDNREAVRKECYREIDNQWNPYYQIEVLKSQLI